MNDKDLLYKIDPGQISPIEQLEKIFASIKTNIEIKDQYDWINKKIEYLEDESIRWIFQ